MRKYRLTEDETETLLVAVEFAYHTLSAIDHNIGLGPVGKAHLDVMETWHDFMAAVTRVTVKIDDDRAMSGEEREMADFLRSLAGIPVINISVPPLHTEN